MTNKPLYYLGDTVSIRNEERRSVLELNPGDAVMLVRGSIDDPATPYEETHPHWVEVERIHTARHGVYIPNDMWCIDLVDLLNYIAVDVVIPVVGEMILLNGRLMEVEEVDAETGTVYLNMRGLSNALTNIGITRWGFNYLTTKPSMLYSTQVTSSKGMVDFSYVWQPLRRHDEAPIMDEDYQDATVVKQYLPGDLNGATIIKMDGLGAGGAAHLYKVIQASQPMLDVKFQEGPILENGINGITNETLLEIVASRLSDFQEGPFPCAENALALDGVHQALDALYARTKARASQDVEGLDVAHLSETLLAKSGDPQ